MVPFSKYQYTYPPRADTDHRVAPFKLAHMQAQGYWAQAKLNGTSNVVAIDPDRQIIAMTRHREAHKAWQPDEITRRAFLHLPEPGFYVFVAELMHSKVPGFRHINYINDILVAGGRYLIGTTFAERQELLLDLYPNAVRHVSGMYSVIDDNTWLAINHTTQFTTLFDRWTQRPECEGLVLKDPKAKLAFCFKPTSNVKWLYKCRRETKVYSH